MRLLVIEDDVELAETVAVGLRRAHWAVDVAHDGNTGLEQALVNDYDVVLLDRDLPGLHGDAVCAQLLQAGRRCRILMLTAASSAQDMVHGLGIGADDYLAKPFDFPVLMARVGALLRRNQPAHPPVLGCGTLVLDTAGRFATLEGRRLDLTPKEFAVLEVLVTGQGRTVTTEELLERAWDAHTDPFTSAVKITVSRLRFKLGDTDLIETVARAGYRVRA